MAKKKIEKGKTVGAYNIDIEKENELWEKFADESYDLIEAQLVGTSYEIQLKEMELQNLTDEMNRLTQVKETLKDIKALREKNEQGKTKRKD